MFVVNVSHFSILKSIRKHLDKYTPYEKLQAFSEKRLLNQETQHSLKPNQIKGEMNSILLEMKEALILRSSEEIDGSFLDILTLERHEEETSTNSEDYMLGFLKAYNTKVIAEIESYCKNLRSNLTDAFTPYFTDIEYDQLNLGDSFEEWYYWFSQEKEYVDKRKMNHLLKYNTFLTEEENAKITDRFKLYHCKEYGVIDLNKFPNLDQDELIKVYKYNLNAMFQKWLGTNRPFLTEDQFLHNEILGFQSLMKENSLNDKVYILAESASRASRYHYARINLQIAEDRMEEIKKGQASPPITKNITWNLINKRFENIKDDCFNDTTSDYFNFLELLTNFFEGAAYNLPERPIILKRGSKKKIAAIFNPLQKDLKMNEMMLKKDLEYLKIIRVLNVFSNQTDGDLYKAITR